MDWLNKLKNYSVLLNFKALRKATTASSMTPCLLFGRLDKQMTALCHTMGKQICVNSCLKCVYELAITVKSFHLQFLAFLHAYTPIITPGKTNLEQKKNNMQHQLNNDTPENKVFLKVIGPGDSKVTLLWSSNPTCLHSINLKDRGFPLHALPPNTTSELTGLFFTLSS